MTNILLGILIVVLAVGIWQSYRQHQELVRLIDSFAEMIGEAIDSWRKGQKGD